MISSNFNAGVGFTHFWKTMRDCENSAPCILHPVADAQHTGCQSTCREPDFFIASGCCHSFSRLQDTHGIPQGQKWQKTENHPTFPVTFGETGSLKSMCEFLEPKIFLSEEVLGFVTGVGSDGQTYLSRFNEEIMSLTKADGTPIFTGSAHVILDISEYICGTRKRVSTCAVFYSAASCQPPARVHHVENLSN